ncbi:hypothetical protein GCM10023156_47760 [Novipirellula rosea]|uniref:Uncharacterized protein n=1 Tax=Novipirellula rosea TaxID=1031540 RepID=A0ABP8N8N9_9BACT
MGGQTNKYRATIRLSHIRLSKVLCVRSSREKLTGTPPTFAATQHFKPEYDSAGELLSSRVTIAVQNGDRPIYFTGIIATMERPGFVTLSIPPEEQWSESLRWLTREQQERFATANCFKMLQMQITGRYLRLLQRVPPK